MQQTSIIDNALLKEGGETTMRDSSYNSSHQSSKQIFSQGGEKKVMKKSFSVLLSAAVAFGSFASLTSAAELTAQEKFDALKAKGIFAGINGEAALDQNMNRAQFARVAALILGLEGIGNPDTLKVTEQPFKDVKLGQWYTEEVAAAKVAKILEGNTDGTFNPTGNITVQELAIVTGKLLGLTPVEGAKVEGAADWAAGYIQAIKDAGVAFPTNYTAAATRSQLVEISYQADAKINPVAPAKVSVASAKATGVKTVAVALDKAVDDTKATLTLKRNGSTVAATAKWSEDKKTATLTLDSAKILEGDYTVTLAGIAAEEIATATASFHADNEKVTKLEFVAPSDTVAQSDHARVDFQALNQYDENVSLAAGSFNAYSNSTSTIVKKDANGKLYVELDTNDSTLIPNVSQIAINLINTDSQITVNKSFKLGSAPYVTKVELGNVTYSNGETYLSKSGDKAVIELLQYDQYGNRITTHSGSLFNASANVTPYLTEIGNPAIVDDNNDNILDVVVQLGADSKATGEYTVSVFGGNTATKVINVKSTKFAASIELDSSVVLAAGDAGVYIPLTATDKDGKKLTAQDIVDNYVGGHFQITTSSNLTLGAASAVLATQGSQNAIVKAGEHKGQLYIASVGAKGIANVFVNITPSSANGILFNKNYQLNIQEKRYPVSLKVNTDNAPKAIPVGGNATSTLKVTAVDQYGAEIHSTIGTILESNRSVTYDVYVEELVPSLGNVTLGSYGGNGAHLALADVLNKDLTFTANAGATVGDELKVKISLRKLVDGTSTVIDNAVSTVTKSMKVIAVDSRLTYSVDGIDNLFNAIDNKLMDGGAADAIGTSKHARTVGISAKDGAGDKVALPSNYVVAISSSDRGIVDTDALSKIIGVKAGTAQIMVTHKTVDGGSSTQYKDVVVKADQIVAASFSNAKGQNTITSTGPATPFNAADVMDLKVKDNYNTEYVGTADEIEDYDKVLGIRYSVSDVQGVTVNFVSATGDYTVTGTGSFTLTASAPNGKTAVTAVIVE